MNESPLQFIRRLGARWAPYLVLLAAVTQVALSFHHHEDLSRHDSCAACEVGHQPNLTSPDFSAVVAILPSGGIECVAALRTTGFASTILCERARGPPV